ncbi:hypothetical protein D9756_002908 [Leucocoprinus leucothites]|uniref:Hypervirulence associated protein TUDOR domain-containing protein n=1 Tax=Leucocoprinus leucothites TaxID=201217 RepID=A0A8H5G7J9_9AGAR|nr:hypothetical protein D9756_002908 [Leucoagaricus leucothites]
MEAPHGFNIGDHVKYQAVGGASSAADSSTTTGEIVEIRGMSDTVGNGRAQGQVSEQEPRPVIRNDSTGKASAYKAGNILGYADEDS